MVDWTFLFFLLLSASRDAFNREERGEMFLCGSDKSCSPSDDRSVESEKEKSVFSVCPFSFDDLMKKTWKMSGIEEKLYLKTMFDVIDEVYQIDKTDKSADYDRRFKDSLEKLFVPQWFNENYSSNVDRTRKSNDVFPSAFDNRQKSIARGSTRFSPSSSWYKPADFFLDTNVIGGEFDLWQIFNSSRGCSWKNSKLTIFFSVSLTNRKNFCAKTKTIVSNEENRKRREKNRQIKLELSQISLSFFRRSSKRIFVSFAFSFYEISIHLLTVFFYSHVDIYSTLIEPIDLRFSFSLLLGRRWLIHWYFSSDSFSFH